MDADRLSRLFFDAMAQEIQPDLEAFESRLRQSQAAQAIGLRPLAKLDLERRIQAQVDAHAIQLAREALSRTAKAEPAAKPSRLSRLFPAEVPAEA